MKIKKLIILIIILSSILICSIFIPLISTQCKFTDDPNLDAIQTSLKIFYLINKRYPTNSEGLHILAARNIEGHRPQGYIEMIPKDRVGNHYHYFTYVQKNGEETAVIWTFGSDELPGGEDEAKDIYRVVKKSKIYPIQEE